MKNVISKLMMAALAIALVLAAIPVTNAYAADETPPAPTAEKLEAAWARQLKMYERLGKAFEDSDAHIAKFQGMIDKAAEKGRDVTSLQAALDAYETALVATRPEYEALGQVFEAHSGFDSNGKVTDLEQAQATVKEVREQAQALRESMGGTFKALREAVKAFREANKPTQETSVGSDT
jgi:predicted  nucleic acid-binding Zn-ribbon protein